MSQSLLIILVATLPLATLDWGLGWLADRSRIEARTRVSLWKPISPARARLVMAGAGLVLAASLAGAAATLAAALPSGPVAASPSASASRSQAAPVSPVAPAKIADLSQLEAQPDMHLGDPNAKVKMIEYQSVACPYCGAFANTVWPDFKKTYIDTGRVYYTSREALTHDPSLASAGFLLARCAALNTGGGDEAYFAVVATLYRRQAELEAPGAKVDSILLDIARSAGLTQAQYTACVGDQGAVDTLSQRWAAYVKQGFGSTPTILINGKSINPTKADLEAAIAAAQQ